mmetsp:Transcript_29704/g.63180  ORF Transcript_29704/g.63180 Transcript_29704/m.63180 type:complete len:350 (-) Transcript_29704:240-1289(-)
MASLIVLRSPSTAHHLHHVHGRQLVPCPLLRVVDLCALDNDGVRRQVHAPGQGGCRHQHLDVSISVQIFNQLPVRSRQARMMDCEAIRQEVLHLLRLDTLDFGLQDFAGGGILMEEFRQRVVLHGEVAERGGRLHSLLPRVHEDEDLILAGIFHELLVAHLIHGVEALDCLLVGDTDVGLLERHRPKLVPEIEEPLLRVHAQEDAHILVIRQRRGEPDKPNVLLSRLDLADCPSHNGLQHRPASVVQEVDLIDDDQADELRVGTLVAGLPRDDVPLLRGGDDDLCLVDLRLCEIDVAAELADDDAVALQALRETRHHLLHKGLHGRHVDNLESRKIKRAVLEAELVHDI